MIQLQIIESVPEYIQDIIPISVACYGSNDHDPTKNTTGTVRLPEQKLV